MLQAGKAFLGDSNPNFPLMVQTKIRIKQKMKTEPWWKCMDASSQISKDKQAAHPILTIFLPTKTHAVAQLSPLSQQLILPLFRKHLKTRSRAQILLSICLVSIVIKLRPTIRDLKDEKKNPKHPKNPKTPTLRRPGAGLDPGTLTSSAKARDESTSNHCFLL